MSLRGLYTVVVTPFDSKGKLDEEGLRQNLRFQLKHRVDGIVLLGTTGEAPTLTSKEKERIIQIGVEEVKGKTSLWVGTGSYSTDLTIEQTLSAEKLGADGAMIVTPYYNRPSQQGLFRHFQAISHAVKIPICIYNIQSRTGQNLQTETLKQIASLPNIVGVKEASGNLAQITDVIETISNVMPGFHVISGDDALTLPVMALGGHGIFSVVSNLIPGPMKKLVDACLTGDFTAARSIHYALMPFFKGAFIDTNPIPIKAAMKLSGMAAGSCRLPLCDLSSENQQRLEHLLKSLPKEWVYG